MYRYESIGNLYSILIEAVFDSVFLLSWEIFSNDYLNASIDSWTISRDQFIEEIFDKRKVKDKHAKIFYLVSNNHLIYFSFSLWGSREQNYTITFTSYLDERMKSCSSSLDFVKQNFFRLFTSTII